MTVKKIERALCSPLFLTIAILETVALVAGFFMNSFDIISILICIGIWIAYSAAKSGKLSEKQTGIKLISGSVKAEYIITWVCIGFIVVGAVINMAAGPRFLHFLSGYVDRSTDDIAEYFEGVVETDEFDAFSSAFDSIAAEESELGNFKLSELNGKAIAGFIDDIVRFIDEYSNIIFAMIGVLMLTCAVASTLINIFYTGNLHKLTKSVCLSVENGDGEIKKTRTVKIWFLVLGILTALSALGSILIPYVVIPAGCKSASLIVAYVLIDRFEKDKDSEPEAEKAIPEQL